MPQYRFNKDQTGILLPEQSEEPKEPEKALWYVTHTVDANEDEPNLNTFYTRITLESHDTDENPYWLADVHSSGCVDLRIRHNDGKSEEDYDYIHICDVDDMIERLQEIKRIAREYDLEDFYEEES